MKSPLKATQGKKGEGGNRLPKSRSFANSRKSQLRWEFVDIHQRIRRERGVLVVDLMGLDPPSAAAMGSVLLTQEDGLEE